MSTENRKLVQSHATDLQQRAPFYENKKAILHNINSNSHQHITETKKNQTFKIKQKFLREFRLCRNAKYYIRTDKEIYNEIFG